MSYIAFMSKEPNTRNESASNGQIKPSVKRLVSKGVQWSAEPIAGTALYQSVRAGFLLQHRSLNRWCSENQVGRSWAYQVLIGSADGPEARKLRRRLISAAGIE